MGRLLFPDSIALGVGSYGIEDMSETENNVITRRDPRGVATVTLNRPDEEGQYGLGAFLNKRRPNWPGPEGD